MVTTICFSDSDLDRLGPTRTASDGAKEENFHLAVTPQNSRFISKNRCVSERGACALIKLSGLRRDFFDAAPGFLEKVALLTRTLFTLFYVRLGLFLHFFAGAMSVTSKKTKAIVFENAVTANGFPYIKVGGSATYYVKDKLKSKCKATWNKKDKHWLVWGSEIEKKLMEELEADAIAALPLVEAHEKKKQSVQEATLAALVTPPPAPESKTIDRAFCDKVAEFWNMESKKESPGSGASILGQGFHVSDNSGNKFFIYQPFDDHYCEDFAFSRCCERVEKFIVGHGFLATYDRGRMD